MCMHTYINSIFGCGHTGSTMLGAAAKVVNFEGLGKRVRPGTFGKISVG